MSTTWPFPASASIAGTQVPDAAAVSPQCNTTVCQTAPHAFVSRAVPSDEVLALEDIHGAKAGEPVQFIRSEEC